MVTEHTEITHNVNRLWMVEKKHYKQRTNTREIVFIAAEVGEERELRQGKVILCVPPRDGKNIQEWNPYTLNPNTHRDIWQRVICGSV